ncbi:MAG: hypothetical protein HYZ39_20715 [Mycolicibacterium cosmeticum]|nr:hypothetical protein [Mycolicibacterium cosmeticum]
MAAHRKHSAKTRKRASEFAVAAFLGLSVAAAAPGIAAAETGDNPPSGDSPSGTGTGAGTGTTGTTTGGTGTTGTTTGTTGETGTGTGSTGTSGSTGGGTTTGSTTTGTTKEETTTSGSTGTSTTTSSNGGPTTTVSSSGGAHNSTTSGSSSSTSTSGTSSPTTGTSTPTTGTTGTPEIPETTEGTGTGTGTTGTGTGTTETPAVTTPVVETPSIPTATNEPGVAAPVVATNEAGSAKSAAKTSLFSATATPVSGALAASSLADLVPAPPDIPAFRPFASFIEQFANAVDKFFPAYPDNPILAPSQVAAGYVVTLQTLLQATLFNGAPTPLSVPVYLFLAAAYTRYERLATNHLPGQPIVSTGPLPGTYKLTSTDPDGDPLIYTTGINQQPSEGLIVMGLDGTFTYVPSPSGLVNGADVTFRVNINDGLGILAHPINPDGNDVEYEVSFHYEGSPILGNHAPTFNTPPAITDTNNQTGVLTGKFQATDQDDDTLSFTGIGVLGKVDVDETPDENGWYTFTYTPYLPHAAAGLNLTDLVTITAWDPGLLSDSATFTVHLSNTVNQTPVASYENTGGSSLLGTVTGKINVDSDDDIVHAFTPVIFTTSKGSVIVSALTGDYTYTANADARAAASVQGAPASAKTDSFTITVDDLHGGTTDVLVTVTIPTVNLAPVFDTQPTIISTNNQTGVLTGTFKAHDDNGDSLSFTSTSLLGSVNVNTTPAADGTYTFTYTPYAPHAAAGLNLTDLVTITVSDGSLLSFDTAAFTVHLSNSVNQTPVASYENTGSNSILGTVTGKINIDSDDDAIHAYTPVIFTTGKGSVIVSALTGDYTYTAGIDARNTASATGATAADKIDTFTITVDDLHGGTTSVQVTVTIPTWNLPPIGGVPSNTLGDNTGIVRGQVNAVINADNDPLSYSIKGATGDTSTDYTGAGGIAHVNADGSYVYIPKVSSGITYSDSFTIVVSDGRGGTSDVLVALGVLSLTSPLDNVNITKTNGAPGVTSGGVSLGSSTNNALFTNYTATGADYGTVVFNGAGYTYTRTATGHIGGTDDTFDVYGTAYGLQIKVGTVTVTPVISNAAPTAGTTTVTSSSVTNVLGVYWQSSSGKVVAADTDGDAISYPGGSLGQLLSTSNGGTVTVKSDGSFSYTIAKTYGYYHAASAIGATGNDLNDTFNMTVTDSFGASTTITVSIPIEKLNEVPSASVPTKNNATDALGVVRGTLNGSDDDDDTLTYTLIGATNGSVKGSNGGIITVSGTSYTYIPTAGKTTDTFQVLVNDGHGGTSTATVSLSGLTTPSATTGVNTSTPNVVTGQLNTAGNTGLTYSVGGQGVKGTVTVTSTGAFTYTRDGSLGHTQTPGDTFTIKATDANGNTVTIATVNVTPTVANNAPTGNGVTTDAPVGSPTYNPLGGPSDKQTTTGTLKATDADGDALTFAAGTYDTANGGSVTVSSAGTFTYTLTKFAPFGIHDDYWHNAAATGYPGDTFTVNVTDGFGGTTAVTYSVPVATLNKVPDSSVSVGSKTTDALGVVRGTVSGSDDDSDGLTYSLVGAVNGAAATANGGIIRFSGNSFTYIPTAGKTTDSFQVLVNDGHGGTSTATVSLSGLTTPSAVTGVNTSTANVVTGQLNTAGNTGLTYSVGSQGAKGTVTVTSTGAFTYTRSGVLGHTQTPGDTFTIKATDANGNSVTIATVSVTPTVANSAPVANGVTVTTSNLATVDLGINRQQTTTGTIKATDADGDTVTFAAGNYDTNNGGSITVAANGTFTYTIKKTKDVPIFGGQDSYWHNAAVPGAPGDVFTITASDLFGGSSTLSFAIPIEKLNTNPTGSFSNTGTDALGVVRGTVSGSDDDGDTTTYSLVGASGGSASSTKGGIVTLSGNTYTYIPTKDAGTDSFNVLVNDGHGGTATVTVSVTATTPSPVTNINTSTNNVVTGNLNIPAGDTGLGLTYSVGSQGAKGTVTVTAAGGFTYTRNGALGHTQTPGDTFTINATDASGKTVTIASVSVTPTVINNVPTASLTTAPTVGTLSGTVQTSTGKITANDTDTDTLSYSASGLASGASVTFNADGTFTYTADITTATRHAAAKYGATAAEKNQTFTVNVTDGYGGTAPVVVTVPIYAVNSAPTISGSKVLLTIGMSTDDADGDNIPTTKNPATGQAGYSLSNGGTLVGILSVGVTYTTTSTVTLTVWDGYYVVTNGVVTSTLSSASKTW